MASAETAFVERTSDSGSVSVAQNCESDLVFFKTCSIVLRYHARVRTNYFEAPCRVRNRIIKPQSRSEKHEAVALFER